MPRLWKCFNPLSLPMLQSVSLFHGSVSWHRPRSMGTSDWDVTQWLQAWFAAWFVCYTTWLRRAWEMKQLPLNLWYSMLTILQSHSWPPTTDETGQMCKMEHVSVVTLCK